MSKIQTPRCDTCGAVAEGSESSHLSHDLDFCSRKCEQKYLEVQYTKLTAIEIEVRNYEQKLLKLQEVYGLR